MVIGLLASERFVVEFWRAKDDRFFGELTMAQAISLGVLAIALILAVIRRRDAAQRSIART